MEGIATRWFLSSTKVVEEYEENVTLYGRVSSRRLFRQQIVTNHRWRTSEVRVNTVNKADEIPSRDFPFDRVRSVLELVPWIILYTWRSFLFALFDRPRVYLWWSVDMKTLFDIIRSCAIFSNLETVTRFASEKSESEYNSPWSNFMRSNKPHSSLLVRLLRQQAVSYASSIFTAKLHLLERDFS